ncbi:receptor like protein kinase S.2 [Iris pallida]|uniref:Receptor like protein kinase S.2 n=1 Tax=Iris pallida TaxID=29817 RepID=A0AAX6EZ62_IRIPA|nr:receptor like protein kinase S.2 [Iris pallida]
MPLRQPCPVLPADTNDTAGTTNKHRLRPKLGRRIGTRVRRSLHARPWRWCFCHKPSVHHRDSCRFEDTPGVAEAGPERKAAGSTGPRTFSYAELYIATSGFGGGELLGSGGFGRVYRAVLPSDGTVAAVKRVARSGARFERTFAAELAAVAQLRHRNLVRLRGWCAHDCQLLLVYDYMPNRSLDRHLFAAAGAAAQPPLSWERRRRIVSGLAAALFYLHEQLDTQIIHRDVKASNVMLDSGYNARLGDFGLARWLEHGGLEASTRSSSASAGSEKASCQFRLTETSRIGGTIGYLPPESFLAKGSATAKTDVFGFGVVALEVATGRRAVDLAFPDDRIILLDWVRRLSDEGRPLHAADRRLPVVSYAMSDMRRLIHLGLLCTLHDPRSRPTMKWVVDALSGADELPVLPSFRSNPLYISLSSSATTTDTRTATFTSSDFLTATGATVFLTADDRGGSSNTDSDSSRQYTFSCLPGVDTPREIPYSEIVAITDGFAESRVVAELDFGTGYRGRLLGGGRGRPLDVLVKRLGMRTCPALRARFASELLNLGRLRHRNLVQLRGWCTEKGEMLVVYDYSSSGLLSHRLFHRKDSVLPWQCRYQIIKSLASAVLYLHEEWDEQVIHRNITSSAVFLDPDMSPRLGSFALAEFLARNERGDHVASLTSSSARGIFGHMAPEYVESGVATTAADAYSFGVLVLEAATGMMAVDFRVPEVLLVKRIRKFEAGMRPLEELADPRLDGSYDRRELVRTVRLGMACTRSDPASRPSMRQIVSILDGNEQVLETVVQKERRRRKKEEGGGGEEWEEKNAASLCLVRRIKALGIQ